MAEGVRLILRVNLVEGHLEEDVALLAVHVGRGSAEAAVDLPFGQFFENQVGSLGRVDLECLKLHRCSPGSSVLQP